MRHDQPLQGGGGRGGLIYVKIPAALLFAKIVPMTAPLLKWHPSSMVSSIELLIEK